MLGYGPYFEKRSNWVSVTIVVISSLGAIGIATLVALTLVKSPIQKRNDNAAPKMGEGFDSSLPGVTPSSLSPTQEPSSYPTLWLTASPSIAESHTPSMASSASPTIARSYYPSTSPSVVSSLTPSDVPRAPPAPVICIDEPGFYSNHAGDKVSCAWFETVGTYNYHKNCDKTDLGKACLLSCKDWNTCILPTDPPSSTPSSTPTSSTPTSSPTPKPPKTLTLVATGDATIKEGASTANYGSSSWLSINEPPLDEDLSIADKIARMQNGDPGASNVLLRFDVDKHDSTRPVKSAELRLKAANDCSFGGYLQPTDSPHWDENTITWDNAPEGDGLEIGSLGSIKSGFLYSVDVTSTLEEFEGHKTLSLRLFPRTKDDECMYVSKDNNSGGGPELHIEYDDV